MLILLPTEMRVGPTVTIDALSNASFSRPGTSNTAGSGSLTTVSSGTRGVQLQGSVASASTAGFPTMFNVNSAVMQFDSEI